jgi:asparagine synthetase B (glutamine-hydrolysing)
MSTKFDRFCLSSCLAFRYVTVSGKSWKKGLAPEYPHVELAEQIAVGTAGEVDEALAKLLGFIAKQPGVAVLLSGGIDSAIVASYMPKGTLAITIDFEAEGAVGESVAASRYAEKMGLDHRIVKVSWDDYQGTMDGLMRRKNAPLHAVEPALFKAASYAASQGVDTLVLGNGADSTFGGLDKLLSRDWTFDDFVRRYTFVDPTKALKEPVDILKIYEPYRTPDGIDFIAFLKTVHGLGIVQAFGNAIGAAGCKTAQPFEDLKLNHPLDLTRIRAGESKYILRELFSRRYDGMKPAEKIPFARPMDQWLKDWRGPRREEFLSPFPVAAFTGDQKWIIYCLERFLNLAETL